MWLQADSRVSGHAIECACLVGWRTQADSRVSGHAVVCARRRALIPCYSHPDVLTAWLWNWYLIIDIGEIDIRNFEYFFSNVTCQSMP